MEVIGIVAFAFFLCVAAVQAVRRHWHNALTALLASILFICLSILLPQSHQNTIYREVLRLQRNQIKKLEIEIDRIKTGSSNQASESTVRKVAEPPR